VHRGLIVGFFTLLFFAGWSTPGAAEVRVYKECAEEDEYLNTFRIKPDGNGTYVSITSKDGKELHKYKELWLDADHNTVKWRYKHPEQQTDFTAFRDGDMIFLNGTHRGEEVERTYEVDGLPWKQQFPLDLERFVLSGERSLKFWAIGTGGPADLKIAKFIALMKQPEKVDTPEGRTEMLKVRITFFGLLSFIWSGEAWHRMSDGRFVRFLSDRAPGHPPTTVKLVEERASAD
jgi:hypothetical protein